MFLILKNPRYRKLDFLSKYQVVKSLNGVISPTTRSKPLVSLGFFMMYLGALTVVPQTALLVNQGFKQNVYTTPNVTGKVAKNDLQSRIANAETPAIRFDLLLQASTAALTNSDTDKALKYLEQAELTYGNINSDQALAQLFLKYSVYHQHINEFTEAAQYQNKAIALFEKTPKKSNYELATSYRNLATIRLKQGKNSQSEMNLQKALSFAVQINQPDHWKTITDISGELLDWYYHEGRQQEAIKLIDTLKTRFSERDEALQSYISMFIYEELGWLHAAANNEKAALEKFDNALQLAEKIPPSTQGKNPDRQQETRIILSKAAVYYKEGYTDFSKIQFDNAESLAREDSFRSLEQYIKKYSPKISAVELKKNQHREIRRWKLITDAFNKVRS